MHSQTPDKLRDTDANAGEELPSGSEADGAGPEDKNNPDIVPIQAARTRYAPPSGGDPRTDEQLLAGHLGGDPVAFPMLMTRYQRELYHFLVRFVGDRAAAEDVFQEAFLQVYQSAAQFDVTRRFKPWLFTIAANKARDLMRAQSRRPMSPLQATISPSDDDSGEFLSLMAADTNTPDQPLELDELRQKVQRVVMAMPSSLREILLLSYFHQFPYKQISDILGIPLGTVKSRLHSAVAQFAIRWKSSNPSAQAS